MDISFCNIVQNNKASEHEVMSHFIIQNANGNLYVVNRNVMLALCFVQSMGKTSTSVVRKYIELSHSTTRIALRVLEWIGIIKEDDADIWSMMDEAEYHPYIIHTVNGKFRPNISKFYVDYSEGLKYYAFNPTMMKLISAISTHTGVPDAYQLSTTTGITVNRVRKMMEYLINIGFLVKTDTHCLFSKKLVMVYCSHIAF